MSTFTFTNNTFAGAQIAGYMSRTLLEADSITRGLITPIPNCKSRRVILLVDDEIVLQDPSARFVDQGTNVVQTERYLDPVTYEFMKEQEYEALKDTWEQDQLKPGSLADYDGVVDLAEYIVTRYLDKIQIANERLYWLGKGDNPGVAAFTAPYAGLLSKIQSDPLTQAIALNTITGSSMTASAGSISGGVLTLTVASTANLQNGDVVTLTGEFGGTLSDAIYGVLSTANPQSYSISVIDATHISLVMNYNEMGNKRRKAAFTGTVTVSGTVALISFINASNVLAVLGAIFAQVDEATRQKPDFNILVPYNVSRAFAIAQANKALNVIGAFTDKKVMDFLGDKLQVMSQWRGNVIVAARASNLFLGVDLASDTSRLKVVYTGDYTNDEVVRMRARMKSDTNYAFANEILYVSA